MNKKDRTIIFRKLTHMLKSVKNKISQIQYETDNGRHYCLLGYSHRTIDLMHGTISLISIQRYSSVHVVFRAAFESYIYFINIIKHDSYDKLIVYHTLKEQISLLKKVKYIKFMKTDEKYIKEKIQKIHTEISKYEIYKQEYQDKFKTVSKRFDAAGLSDAYYSIYPLLCGDSHSDMLAIERTNLVLTGEGLNWDFTSTGKYNYNIGTIIYILIDMMVYILAELNEFYDMAWEKDIEAIELEGENIKDNLVPEDD